MLIMTGYANNNTEDGTSSENVFTKAKVCMFPEGTRHGGSDLLPFKKGAFHVAIASQTAILPVVVSRYHFLDSERHVFDKGSSIISILPPIKTEGLTKADLDSLMSKTHSVMSDAYTQLSQEVLVASDNKTK